MCGITGAIGFINTEYKNKIEVINETMKHRGPDASGIWTSGIPDDRGVVFAHRRLSIIDLHPESNQPFLDSKSGAVITYNGEVYNFIEIKKELISFGHNFRTNCDTEVVLKSYLQWGADCLTKFRGMFAFAIYDPENRKVFIARDRIGIKPLYFTTINNGNGLPTIIFASEIRAVLESGLIKKKIDPVGLSSFLWNGFISGPNSFISNIQRIDSGTFLMISLDDLSVSCEKYWEIPGESENSDSSSLKDALMNSVRMRMIGDVPLGVFLSGGIDSSALTAIAVKYSSAQVNTFNISFEENKYDESKYARKVAKILGTNHTEVCLTQNFFREHLIDALESLDQPTFDAINTYFVSRAVKDAGITVAIAGTGGDELFGGYSSFRELPVLLHASKFLHLFPKNLIRKFSNNISNIVYGIPDDMPHQTRWAKLGEALCLNGDLFKLYQLSYSMFLPDFYHELTNGELPIGCICGVPEKRAEVIYKNIAGSSVLHSVSQLELSNFITDRLLIDTDMTSMASSLEVRVPLLDHVVIENASTVNAKMRFNPLGKKQILREIALKDIDADLFNRPKSGFELPIEEWSKNILKNEIDEIFSDKSLCESVGLNSVAVNRMWTAYNANAPGLYWSRIWSIFILLWWARRYGVTL